MKRVLKTALTAMALYGVVVTPSIPAFAQAEEVVIVDRDEGQGPYNRLILRGAYMIDGTGAPTQGPVDIVVENDRIKEIVNVGNPKMEIDPKRRPALNGGKEIDLNGMYIMPGFVDSHLHLHNKKSGQNVPADYVLKLWFSHGITSGRTVGGDNGTPWGVKQKKRLANNEITGPRLLVFPFFGGKEAGPINTPKQARARVKSITKMGADGIKFYSQKADVLWAALDEANKLKMDTTMHHAQLAVTQANVLDTSAHGLKMMEHWYGLPEAMFEDKQLQRYPNDYIYNNEQHRFGEAGRLWKQAAKP